MFRTLDLLPGVAATDDFGSRLAVRGGTPDQNLSVMDGVEIHNLPVGQHHLDGAGKGDDEGGGRRTSDASGSPNVFDHLVGGVLMVIAVDPKAQILLDPDDVTFVIDERGMSRPAQLGEIHALEGVSKIQRIVTGREQDGAPG